MEKPDQLLLNFLKTQIGLTAYETLAFVMVAQGKDQPGNISEAAGIPRPKVYGALETLEKKGYIRKSESGYEPNINMIALLKENAELSIQRYRAFIDLLYTASVGTNKLLSNIRGEIPQVIEKVGYQVETQEKILRMIGDKERLRKVAYDYPNLEYFAHERGRYYDTRQKKITEEKFILPEFIAESRNFGIRIGIILVQQLSELIENITVTVAALDLSRCNAIAIIAATPSDRKKLPGLEYFDMSRIQVNIISNTDNHLSELEKFLVDIELKWSRIKSKLNELEEKRDTAKQQSRNLIFEVDNIMESEELYPSDYKSIFADMLTRIKNDLETNNQVLSQLDERISAHFDYLERKTLFPFERLLDTEKRLEDALDNLKEKGKELASFEEELYSIPDKVNPYRKYGFKLNPFSLFVPLEKPNLIINQSQGKKIAEEFIQGVSNGLDANFLMLIGNQGVGKSHFLNFFANQINNKIYGKHLALSIRCKANRDIVDLYPQIVDALKRVLEEKQETELMTSMTRLLSDAGTPRLVQDLMKLLKAIEAQIATRGYQRIFFLLDEFENSLPPLQDNESSIPAGRLRRRIGTPQAIPQLATLTKLAGTGFIITFRRDYWEWWGDEIRNRVSKLENKYIVEINPLSLDDSRDFLNHRLEFPEFRTTSVNEHRFSDEALQEIWSRSKGNPRAMLRLASTAFRKSIRDNVKVIESKMIE